MYEDCIEKFSCNRYPNGCSEECYRVEEVIKTPNCETQIIFGDNSTVTPPIPQHECPPEPMEDICPEHHCHEQERVIPQLVVVEGAPGKNGLDGKDLEFEWVYTDTEIRLGVRVKGTETWYYSPSLIGPQGPRGFKGEAGDTPYVGPGGTWWIGQTNTGIDAKSGYELPIASKEALGGIKLGGDLEVTKDGTLNIVFPEVINDYTIPNEGESHTVQTLFGNYNINTIVSPRLSEYRSSLMSNNQNFPQIESTTSVRYNKTYTNSAFLLTVNGVQKLIYFGADEGDFSENEDFLEVQTAFQTKIDAAFGVEQVVVTTIDMGSRYKVRLTSSTNTIVVNAYQGSDFSNLLTIVKFNDGMTNVFDISTYTIQEWNQNDAQDIFTLNGATIIVEPTDTIQQVFDKVAMLNIGLAMFIDKDRDCFVIQATSSEVTDITFDDCITLNSFGFYTNTKDIYFSQAISGTITITDPNGVTTENIVITQKTFTFDNLYALLMAQIQLMNTKLDNVVNNLAIKTLNASEENKIDFNTLIEPQFYVIKNATTNTCVNGPALGSSGTIILEVGTKNGVVYQSVMTNTNNGLPYHRQLSSGTWSSWLSTIGPNVIRAGILNTGMACNTPTADNHITNKKYVDAGLAQTIPNTVVGNIVAMTQEAYDGLETKNPKTLYLIVEESEEDEESNSLNLVANGDFENGLDGWTCSYPDNVSITKDTSGYEGSCMKLTVTSVYATSEGKALYCFVKHNVDVIATHVYYISGYYKGSASNHSYMSAQMRFEYALNQTIANTSYPNAQTTTWTKLSGYGTCSTTATGTIGVLIHAGYNNGDITTGMTISYDKIRVYDLTAIYGAGNEPTQEWCDENL